MEIEKKYLVSSLPENLDQYPHEEIEQAYLCDRPTLRIRRRGDRYIFTYKGRDASFADESLCIADEVERPLSQEAYEHLREKADGRVIVKTRYRIPYESYTIELDIFHEIYEGFCLAEVEFETAEEGHAFIPPSWFGSDVSGDVRYTNNYMSITTDDVDFYTHS